MATENIDKVGSEISSFWKPLPDILAREEVKEKFCGDDLRAEQKKKAIHVLFLIAIYVVVGVVLGLFIARMLQCVLPASMCWLTPEQDKYIEDFIFHGTIGAIVMATGKEIISSHTKPGGK